MSKLVVDTIEGKTGTTVTVPTGQTLAVGANQTVGGTLAVTSNQTIGGTLAVTGTSTLTGVVSKPATPRLSVWKYTSQVIAHDTYTMVKLDGTDRIANGMTGFTQSNTHTRWTAATAGDYYIGASLRWYTSSAISTSMIEIKRNGTTLTRGYSHSLPNYEQMHASTLQTLAADDYLELSCYQYSGGNVTLNAQDDTIKLLAFKVN